MPPHNWHADAGPIAFVGRGDAVLPEVQPDGQTELSTVPDAVCLQMKFAIARLVALAYDAVLA